MIAKYGSISFIHLARGKAVLLSFYCLLLEMVAALLAN